MRAVPAARPVTTPVDASTDPAALAVLQVWPVVAEESVVVPPTQVESVPVIAAGRASIITVLNALQPPGIA